MMRSPVDGRLSARGGGSRGRWRHRGGDRGWDRRWDRRFVGWSDDDGAADLRRRGRTVGVRLHEAEDDEAEAGYAGRRERADDLGYAYGLSASAMVSHDDSFGGASRDARGDATCARLPWTYTSAKLSQVSEFYLTPNRPGPGDKPRVEGHISLR
jgi:hypothetical protein